MTVERLHKFLSRAGVASRRTAEEWIRAGRVAVNGQVVTEMGVKIDADQDKIQVDGRFVEPPLPPLPRFRLVGAMQFGRPDELQKCSRGPAKGKSICRTIRGAWHDAELCMDRYHVPPPREAGLVGVLPR